MAATKENAEKSEEPEGGLNKKTIKKVFFGGEMLLVGIAFFILLIMFFVAWDFIDKTEKLVKRVAGDACETLTAVEILLESTEAELSLAAGTVEGIGQSMTSLSDGLGDASDALGGLDDSLGVLESYGVHLGGELGNAAASLGDASDSLENTTAGLAVHTEKISELQSDVGEIRANVSSQKQTVCDESNIIGIFDSMRLTVIILFLLAAALIGILFFNSAAGII
ncbi:hypothetical protein H0O02_04300 [Candidatus Micrarchaeota archaeon]|nr:hypothetical protein [Candidatus Micrarchaeota archaeon]